MHRSPLALLLAFISLLPLPPCALADSIGFNFVSERAPQAALDPGEAAGVVPQKNWNNFLNIPAEMDGPYTWGTDKIGSPNAGVVTEDDGVASTILPEVTVSWTALHSWAVPNNPATDGDDKLMNGYIDNDPNTPQMTVTVGNLPASYTLPGYAVIAYFGSDENGRTGTVGITDGETYTYSSDSDKGGAFPDAYVQTTDTGGGNPPANYAVWENQSADTLTLTIDRGSNNSGFHGLQIIANPSGAPAFAITSIDHDEVEDSVTITWSAKAGRIYAVDVSADLTSWSELDDGITAESDTGSFTETSIAAGTLTRFYRVRRIE